MPSTDNTNAVNNNNNNNVDVEVPIDESRNGVEVSINPDLEDNEESNNTVNTDNDVVERPNNQDDTINNGGVEASFVPNDNDAGDDLPSTSTGNNGSNGNALQDLKDNEESSANEGDDAYDQDNRYVDFHDDDSTDHPSLLVTTTTSTGSRNNLDEVEVDDKNSEDFHYNEDDLPSNGSLGGKFERSSSIDDNRDDSEYGDVHNVHNDDNEVTCNDAREFHNDENVLDELTGSFTNGRRSNTTPSPAAPKKAHQKEIKKGFRRAPEEVLKTRRIIKVRQPTKTTPVPAATDIGAQPTTTTTVPAATGFGVQPSTTTTVPAATGFGVQPSTTTTVATAATGFGVQPSTTTTVGTAATGFSAQPTTTTTVPAAATGFSAQPATTTAVPAAAAATTTTRTIPAAVTGFGVRRKTKTASLAFIRGRGRKKKIAQKKAQEKAQEKPLLWDPEANEITIPGERGKISF